VITLVLNRRHVAGYCEWIVAATDESSSDEWKFPVSSSSSSSRFTEDRRTWRSSSGGSVWFRAAVIAVPIVGLVALVLLVLLASHLLSADSRSRGAAAMTFWRWRSDVESCRPDTGTRMLPPYQKITCVCGNLTSYHCPQDVAEFSLTVT